MSGDSGLNETVVFIVRNDTSKTNCLATKGIQLAYKSLKEISDAKSPETSET